MNAGLVLLTAVVLRGATVHTALGPAIPNGVVVVSDGKIAAVGGPETPVPPGAEVLDLTGKHIAPAFFAPASLAGLVEIQAVRATVDVTEIGEINPEARPETAMNLDSEVLPVTRSNGVLFAALVPKGSVLPGAASVVALEGYTREDACVKCPAAVVLEWPEMAIDRSPDARPSARAQEKRRDEALERIRAAFRSAKAYRTAKRAEKEPGVPAHDEAAPMAGLVPVLEGKVPLLVRASTKQQIEALLRWLDGEMRGESIRVVLLGAHDAPKLAGRLAARKISVILESVLELPRRMDDPYDAPFAAAAALQKAGVVVAIAGGDDASQARNLPYHAAMASAFGLDRVAALQAITWNPARIFAVDERIGSLAPGREASIAVFTGDPLQIDSELVTLWHAGRALDLSDRHKRLWERYRNRPKPAR